MKNAFKWVQTSVLGLSRSWESLVDFEKKKSQMSIFYSKTLYIVNVESIKQNGKDKMVEL